MLHMVGDSGAFDIEWAPLIPPAETIYIPAAQVPPYTATLEHRRFKLHKRTECGAIYIEESVKK